MRRAIGSGATKRRGWTILGGLLAVGLLVALSGNAARAELRAGALVVDITPRQLPVFVNGGMFSRTVDKIHTRVHARALALADGETTVVIVVADSCILPRDLLDAIKTEASKRTGIPPERMLISATHTHTAPSCFACLGTDADPTYVPFFKERVVSAIEGVVKKLQPAKVGFGSIDAAEFTALRRWIRRPDRIAVDPFGNPTVRANMHSARNWDDVTGPSGPEDPELSMIAVQSLDGKPIAVLANFSMHYFGDRDISADYFGRFCDRLKQRVAPGTDFVAILSHGCSGDIWRRDYTKRAPDWDPYPKLEEYTEALVDRAYRAYREIDYQQDADLCMAQKELKMRYRVPDRQRLEWAQRIVEAMGDRPPKTRQEVYAREQVILDQWKETEVVLQALRIGEMAIATTSTETYALTGLKIKSHSPLAQTMVIELANGGDGYIPPPEQHLLGGYNTWAARSAGLEVTAEPRIAEAAIELLEQVCGRPRRLPQPGRGPAAEAIAKSKPIAWWRLEEMAGPRAVDATGHGRDAIYEPGVVFFLEGPRSEAFHGKGRVNRAAMFAGGRLEARLPELGDRYTISLWIWNGMPTDGRDVTGWILSRGWNHGAARGTEHLGIGGTSGHQGRLIWARDDTKKASAAGKRSIERWTWHHVAYVRDGENVQVYLDGELEIETRMGKAEGARSATFFFGGRSDNHANWEGRLDEIAVFDRVLSAQEVRTLSGR